MADENKTKGGSASAVADDGEWEYSGPPKPADDEWEYSGPAAATTTPKTASPAKQPVGVAGKVLNTALTGESGVEDTRPRATSWLGRRWQDVQTGKLTPINALSQGVDAVGNWADRKSEEAHQRDLVDAANGKPKSWLSRDPASTYDFLGRTAHTVAGATSPGAALTTAAAIAAPEVVGPAALIHGGIGTVQGTQKAIRNPSPENVGNALNAAGETVGGAAMVGHNYVGRTPGPITRAILDRNPVARGEQAYLQTIAPNSSGALEQVDDAEAIRRARPYLSEEERNRPVLKEQPGTNKYDPNAGLRRGVMNYRQNAQSAAQRLWQDKIQPITDSYGKAPIDYGKVSADIRGTIDPNGPPNAAKNTAVGELADHYNKPTTVSEAMAKIKALNDDKAVLGYEKALPDKQIEMLNADPGLEAKVKAVNSLRDAVFDSIEKNGTPQEADYVREARKDYGALQQVAENLGKSQVPSARSFLQKAADTGRTLARPKSAPISKLFAEPNKLAAKSSRLFGVTGETGRAAPPIRTTPWAPPTPQPFIVPPGAPQAPPPVQPQFAVEGTGTVQNSSPPGTTRIAGLLPAPASTVTPPVDPYFRQTGIGSIVDPNQVAQGRTVGGGRTAPAGLLPGPTWEQTTNQPQVGGLPRMGFPANEGPWNIPPQPGSTPGFETPPNAFAEPPTGQVTRPGGLGTIGGGGIQHGPTPAPIEAPSTAPKPFPKGKVDTGNMGNLNERPNFLKKAPEKPTGTANDRPQVKYKPSEKVATQSEKQKPLGKEFDTEQARADRDRMNGIMDNPDASDEDKTAAKQYFKDHPDARLEKVGDTRTADERVADRQKAKENGAKPQWKVETKGDQRFAVEKGPNGIENRVSFKEGESNDAIRKRLDDQADMRKKFFSDRQAEKAAPTEEKKPPTEDEYREAKNALKLPATLEPEELAKHRQTVREFEAGKKNGNFLKKPEGASPDQVFGQDKAAEEKAATEYTKPREDYRAETRKRAADALEKDMNKPLPGMEEHVAKQNEGAAKVAGEKLTEQAKTPKSIDEAAGEMERKSPLFRGTEASPQREIFGQKPGEKPAEKFSVLNWLAERAGEAPKPLQEEFTQEEIRAGELAALQDAEATLSSDKPGVYYDQTENPHEQNPKREQRADKGVTAFGRFRGVKSGRNMLPVLRELPDMSATDVLRALRNPKSPAYEKVVRVAAKYARSAAAKRPVLEPEPPEE